MLEWLHPMAMGEIWDGDPSDVDVCSAAVRGETHPIVLWAVERGYRDSPSLARTAARTGCMPTLEWVLSIHPSTIGDDLLCTQAALGGRLEALRWLRDRGAQLNSGLYVDAALACRLDIADWLRENGCPWEEWITMSSLYDGDFDLLEWALGNGLLSGAGSANLPCWDDFERWLAGKRDGSDLPRAKSEDSVLRSEWDDLEKWLARPRASEARIEQRWHAVGGGWA